MNKKSLITMAATLILLGAVGVGATLAYFTDSTSITNVFATGHVDIEIEEDSIVSVDTKAGEKQEDGSISYENVLPGDVLSKIVTVTGSDTTQDYYLRFKTDVTDGYEDVVLNISDDFVFIDGYYYFTEIVQGNTAITLFTTVSIPTSWNNQQTNKTFNLGIVAEAIQAANFTPDFTSQDPWTNAGAILQYTP